MDVIRTIRPGDKGSRRFHEKYGERLVAMRYRKNDQGQLLTRFLKAEIKGYRWAQQNPEQAATIAEKHIREVEHALMTRGMRGMSDLGVYGLDGGITLEKIDQTQKLLVDLGALRRTVKADEVATTQFVEQAVKELGPASR